MDSSFATSTIQVGTFLITSLTFFVLSTGMLRRAEVKNTILNIWYIVSLFSGFCSIFLSSFLLIWLNSSTDTSESTTTGEIIIWYIDAILCSIQMSSFVVAYSLSLFFRFNHNSCERIVLPLNDEDNSFQNYAVTFTKKRFIITFILWLVLELGSCLITYILAYIALLN